MGLRRRDSGRDLTGPPAGAGAEEGDSVGFCWKGGGRPLCPLPVAVSTWALARAASCTFLPWVLGQPGVTAGLLSLPLHFALEVDTW